MTQRRMKERYWLLIEPEIMRLVDAQAAQADESRQTFIRRAIRRELDRVAGVPGTGNIRDVTEDAAQAA